MRLASFVTQPIDQPVSHEPDGYMHGLEVHATADLEASLFTDLQPHCFLILKEQTMASLPADPASYRAVLLPLSPRVPSADNAPTPEPFPVQPDWDAPRSIWHEAYPSHVPPRIHFQPQRVEQLLLSAADLFPHRTALQYFATAWSYQFLISQVQRVAGHLQALGMRPGDRMMMVLPNCPEFVALWFAAHWIGVEVVPANPLLAAPELVALAKKCQVKAVVGIDVKLHTLAQMTRDVFVPLLVTVSLAPHLPLHFRAIYWLQKWKQGRVQIGERTLVLRFEELVSSGHWQDRPVLQDVDLPAVLQPTGGTTGTPKVAVLTHRNLSSNVAQLHVWSGLRAGQETFLSVLPFFHVYGATCAMLSPLSGGSTLLLQARFDVRRTLKLIQKGRPGIVLLVPFMIASLNEELRRRGQKLEGIRLCMSGASALSSEVAATFQELTGARIMEGFGMSEASPVTHSNPSDGTARIGSIGLPIPNTEARLMDLETGTREVALGEVGELAIRGPQVMRGYLDDPEETAIAIRDGWLFTGDLARMDEDGYFRVVDRKKDMIKSGGLNVYPSEIEHVLAQHAEVLRCAVVGVPDSKYGELVRAWVVRMPGCKVTAEQLKAFCRSELAAYKIPKDIQFCDQLPENYLGKIRRVDLRARAA